MVFLNIFIEYIKKKLIMFSELYSLDS